MTNRMLTSRWLAPGLGVVLGVAMLIAFGIGGDWWAGVACLGVMAVYLGVLLVGRGRSESLAVLGGDTSDERRSSIDRDATVASSYVLVAVIIGAFLWEAARGEDGQPWVALGAIGGATYIVAVLVLRRLR